MPPRPHPPLNASLDLRTGLNKANIKEIIRVDRNYKGEAFSWPTYTYEVLRTRKHTLVHCEPRIEHVKKCISGP